MIEGVNRDIAFTNVPKDRDCVPRYIGTPDTTNG